MAAEERCERLITSQIQPEAKLKERLGDEEEVNAEVTVKKRNLEEDEKHMDHLKLTILLFILLTLKWYFTMQVKSSTEKIVSQDENISKITTENTILLDVLQAEEGEVKTLTKTGAG
ncbi:hypothetical protein P4O66_007688, partial [Electrophorus voltai]